MSFLDNSFDPLAQICDEIHIHSCNLHVALPTSPLSHQEAARRRLAMITIILIMGVLSAFLSPPRFAYGEEKRAEKQVT